MSYSNKIHFLLGVDASLVRDIDVEKLREDEKTQIVSVSVMVVFFY